MNHERITSKLASRPLKARLAELTAAGVAAVLAERLIGLKLSPAQVAVAYVLACGTAQTSSGRWFVSMSASEIALRARLSDRHVVRARSALIEAGVFSRVPLDAVSQEVMLELPRPDAAATGIRN